MTRTIGFNISASSPLPIRSPGIAHAFRDISRLEHNISMKIHALEAYGFLSRK